MTSVEVVRAATEEVRMLVDELERSLALEYPAEQRHGLSLDAIFQPHIEFFIARLDGAAVGCGGVAFFESFGEVKRMYVRDRVRGRGIARALLTRIEMAVRERGFRVLRLETGVRQTAAIRLYESAGFRECGAFGEYAHMAARAIQTSRFYEKRLAASNSGSALCCSRQRNPRRQIRKLLLLPPRSAGGRTERLQTRGERCRRHTQRMRRRIGQGFLVQLDDRDPALRECESKCVAHGAPLGDGDVFRPRKTVFQDVGNPARSIYEERGDDGRASHLCELVDDGARRFHRESSLAPASGGDRRDRFGRRSSKRMALRFRGDPIGFERETIALRARGEEAREHEARLTALERDADRGRAPFERAQSEAHEAHGFTPARLTSPVSRDRRVLPV